MAAGRDIQLAKQVGEYLVAAELCRLGFITTTFTGNVPHFDLIASGSKGNHLVIQVKASRSGNWHLNATRFINITFKGSQQVLGKKTSEPYPNLIYIFVILGLKNGEDKFFIIRWCDLQKIVVKDYREYMRRCNGVRPKRCDSVHTAISQEDLSKYENNWSVINNTL